MLPLLPRRYLCIQEREGTPEGRPVGPREKRGEWQTPSQRGPFRAEKERSSPREKGKKKRNTERSDRRRQQRSFTRRSGGKGRSSDAPYAKRRWRERKNKDPDFTNALDPGVFAGGEKAAGGRPFTPGGKGKGGEGKAFPGKIPSQHPFTPRKDDLPSLGLPSRGGKKKGGGKTPPIFAHTKALFKARFEE